MCMVPFLWSLSLMEKKKNIKQAKRKKNIKLLRFIHFMLEDV